MNIPPDRPIDKMTAAEWAKNYRDDNPGAIKAYVFQDSALDDIMKQDTCEYVRFYFGIDKEDPKNPIHKLFAVGVDKAGNDLVNGLIVDFSSPCPAYCSDKNILNGGVPIQENP